MCMRKVSSLAHEYNKNYIEQLDLMIKSLVGGPENSADPSAFGEGGAAGRDRFRKLIGNNNHSNFFSIYDEAVALAI